MAAREVSPARRFLARGDPDAEWSDRFDPDEDLPHVPPRESAPRGRAAPPPATITDLVQAYLADLRSKAWAVPWEEWWPNYPVGPSVYECWAIHPNDAPVGAERGAVDRSVRDRWLYRKTLRLPGGRSRKELLRRIPFLEDDMDVPKGPGNRPLHASHLCHHSWCFNPYHIVLEEGAANQGRNGCPGREGCCQHDPPCIRPGRSYTGSQGGILLRPDAFPEDDDDE